MSRSALPVIPAPDPIGIPAPPWALQGLLLLTFVLHLIPMTLLLGSALMTAWAEVTGRLRGSESHLRLARHLAPLLPTVTAYAVTLGVAPLLFVQLLYGQFFYCSSALLGWAWLALVGLLLVAYAGFYLYFWRGPTPEAPGARSSRMLGAAAVVSGLALVVVAYLWTANSSLMLDPTRWWGIWTSGSTAVFYAGDSGVWPRLMVALGAAGVSASLYVILLAGRSTSALDRAFASRVASLWVTIGGLLALAGGVWYSRTLPGGVQVALHQGAARWLGWLAVLGVLITGGCVLGGARSVGRQPASRLTVWSGASGFVLTLVVGSVARHLVRQAFLGPYLEPASWQVRPQWDVFALFALILVLGLAFVAYLASRLQQSRTPLSRGHRPLVPAAGGAPQQSTWPELP